MDTPSLGLGAQAAAEATRPALLRTAPFLLFMAFIALDEALRFLDHRQLISLSPTALYYLYPVKTITVAALLWHGRRLPELRWRDLAGGKSVAVVAAGLATCVLWVLMDWTFPISGAPQGFNPLLFPDQATRITLTLFRVTGAVLVVPLMEELFWRSFLIRYLIDQDFRSVPIGRFTWASFAATVLLFGLEHHFILAGMMAGAVYNLILYKTRSLAHCVLAHAVTNLALAGYVLFTGKWYFW